MRACLCILGQRLGGELIVQRVLQRRHVGLLPDRNPADLLEGCQNLIVAHQGGSHHCLAHTAHARRSGGVLHA